MAVVINEFEIISEPPVANQPTGSTTNTATIVSVTAYDLEKIVQRQLERFARIRAH